MIYKNFKRFIFNSLHHFFKRVIVLSVVLLCFLGCDSFVEVDLPPSQLTSEIVFRETSSADAAMSDVYAKLRDQGIINGSIDGMTSQLGSYADELRFFGNSSATGSYFYNNNLLPTTRTIADWWRTSYNSIYACNAIIEGLKSSKEIPQDAKDIITGEALFVRSLQYFYLVNLYGPIPLITGTDYKQNAVAQRQTIGEVYAKIETDLLLTVSIIPEKYRDALRIRPNKGTARALLARVYLYEGKWKEAGNQASEVISDPLYKWEPDLNKVFFKESTATIFQLMPSAAGGNTIESTVFYFTSGPPSRVALSQTLMSGFEPGDQRLPKWIATVTKGTGGPYYRPFKYKNNINTGTSIEYSIVFRLAETYLIRAEALARQEILTEALSDLNFIRNYAGLPKSTAATQQEIINAILHERQVELFTEQGHRFFDLKRTGNLDAILKPSKPNWETSDALMPLPETELLLNPALGPQNPGY
ncbi:RagB/SusD family nutrient uptake outer membrane protein [Flavobacterium anhuiense]|uniref:RagB/SusD family nutrient uptake outer membrane protein n=1 Tax=Flavobacterium anhuiense TaxID=459526 RepID=UPI000E6CE189|nr:RagB/SusD family nutrient uptake outer membrane protein [Flavobacterium anhuiense]